MLAISPQINFGLGFAAMTVLYWQNNNRGQTLRFMSIRVAKGCFPELPRNSRIHLKGPDVVGNEKFDDPQSSWLLHKLNWHGSHLAKSYFLKHPPPEEHNYSFCDYQVALGYILAIGKPAVFLSWKVPKPDEIKLIKKWGVSLKIRDLLV